LVDHDIALVGSNTSGHTRPLTSVASHVSLRAQTAYFPSPETTTFRSLTPSRFAARWRSAFDGLPTIEASATVTSMRGLTALEYDVMRLVVAHIDRDATEGELLTAYELQAANRLRLEWTIQDGHEALVAVATPGGLEAMRIYEAMAAVV
jgi:hypothetical protein